MLLPGHLSQHQGQANHYQRLPPRLKGSRKATKIRQRGPPWIVGRPRQLSLRRTQPGQRINSPELFSPIHCWTILTVEGVKEADVMKKVSDILNSKGHDIWAVKPDDTVFESLQLMAEKEVGALLVMDQDRLVGIVTERDYARKVILEGKSSKDSSVAEVMTKHVLCVTPERTIDECMALMTDKRARHLPVVDHKRVIGRVSIGDLVKALLSEQQVLIDQLQHYISG